MDRVRGEGEWFDRVAGRATPVEVVDANGRVLGIFAPAPAAGPNNGVEPTATEMGEAERTSGRWYTTDEVLAHLRSLG